MRASTEGSRTRRRARVPARVRARVLAASLAALVASTPLGGQSPPPALAGVVVEAGTGLPVEGADVRVRGPADRRAVTGADGRWSLDVGRDGPWELRVQRIGFASWSRTIDRPTREVRAVLTPTPVPLDAVVVTAARRRQPLAEAVVATELVSRREIAETGASDLTSVLTERTGVALQGGHPAGAGLMIQGMGSERVLILVDGQPYIGRIAGTIDASRIPTSMIERVEVVKGPQSTLYGSEAMGGVVNVVTRSPQVRAWRFDASATRGERGRDEARVGASGSAGDRVALLADAGRRVAELVPGRPDEAAARTTRWDGLVRLGWQATDSLSLDVSGLALDESQRYRTGQLHSFVDNLQGSGHVRAAWRHGPHRLTPALYATAFEHRSAASTSDEPPASGAERELQRLAEAELLYSVRLGAQTLDVGVEARRESIRSDRVQGRRRDISTLESFLQATVTAGPVTLVPGLRASFSDPWGRHWTPRVAALLRPRPDLALRASVGQGFRAPDFKELHMEFLNLGPGFGYTVRGNPDLRPESSRNVTAGVTWTGERAYVHLQGFDNRFDRFIETRAVGDSAGVTVYTYGNIDDGFTRGLEVEAGLTWAAWRLEGSYGALQAEHGDVGEPLLGRPTSSARGTLGWVHPSGLRLSFAGVYTGTTAMHRTEEGETLHRDPFLRFDARASRTLPGNLDLIVGADNLFDARSAEWPGFTGRQLYVTVAWVSGGRGG